jgi:hypothetical protein
MATGKTTPINRFEIAALCDRLEARGKSRMMLEQCHDLITAARVLRAMLGNGMPVTAIEIEIENGTAAK